MNNFTWANNIKDVAVTVSDTTGKILYMNDLSFTTFCKDGVSIIGRNLKEFHSPRSNKIIEHLLATETSNEYTIEKNGIHKLIKQSCWYNPDNTLGGLIELSIIIAPTIPHHIR